MTQSHFHNIYWRPLLAHAGLSNNDGDELHFHALRHFFASWMIAKGMSVTDVANMLGHKNFDITLQVYAHPLIGMRERQESLDQMLGEFGSRRASLANAPGEPELMPKRRKRDICR